MPLFAVELTLSPGSLAQGDVHLFTTRLWLLAKIYKYLSQSIVSYVFFFFFLNSFKPQHSTNQHALFWDLTLTTAWVTQRLIIRLG